MPKVAGASLWKLCFSVQNKKWKQAECWTGGPLQCLQGRWEWAFDQSGSLSLPESENVCVHVVEKQSLRKPADSVMRFCICVCFCKHVHVWCVCSSEPGSFEVFTQTTWEKAEGGRVNNLKSSEYIMVSYGQSLYWVFEKGSDTLYNTNLKHLQNIFAIVIVIDFPRL